MGGSKFVQPIRRLGLMVRRSYKWVPPAGQGRPTSAEQGEQAKAELTSEVEERGAIFALQQAAVVAAQSRPPEPLPDSAFELCEPAPFTQGSSNPGHFSCSNCWTTRSTRFSRYKDMVLCKRCGQHMQRWGELRPLDKQCSHCGTTRSGYWRKLKGQIVCNACGVYPRQEHSKGKMRPVGQPMKIGSECACQPPSQRPALALHLY